MREESLSSCDAKKKMRGNLKKGGRGNSKPPKKRKENTRRRGEASLV